LSILEVYKIGDKLKGVLLYLCPEKFEYLEKLSEKEDWACKLLYNAESEEYVDEYLTAIEFKKNFKKNILLINL